MTKYQDLKNEVKRFWKLKNAKVVPVIFGATGMTKNLCDINNHPWEYHYKQAAVGNCPGLSADREESPRHKSLRTENFTAWPVIS